jgi:hypothetical protein
MGLSAGWLPDWISDPALLPLWERAAERLEQTDLVPRGAVVLTGLDRSARHALAPLLERERIGERAQVNLVALDDVLRRRSGVGGLLEVCEAVRGRRLVDRAAIRSSSHALRRAPLEAMHDWLARHPDMAGEWTESWLAGLRRSGILARLEDPSATVVVALEVVARLTSSRSDSRPDDLNGPPVEPGFSSAESRGLQGELVSRTDLAVAHTGDAHALDHGEPLGQLVLRGLAGLDQVEVPRTAAARRARWEAFGVSTDSVSSTCLTLGLAALDGPFLITGWSLDHRIELMSRPVVFVCENPRVLEACAERIGSVPMVCTAGVPNLVVLRVLSILRDRGSELRYHGDFDWPGIAIANRLIARPGVHPWRMAVDDYLAHVRRNGPPLAGSVVEPTWSSELGAALRQNGVAVHEEAMLEPLLADARPHCVSRLVGGPLAHGDL